MFRKKEYNTWEPKTLEIFAIGGEDRYLVTVENSREFCLFFIEDFPKNKEFAFLGNYYEILEGKDVPGEEHQVEPVPGFSPVFCVSERPVNNGSSVKFYFNEGKDRISIKLDTRPSMKIA